MAKKDDYRSTPGMIYKAAELTAQEATPDEMEAINRFTLTPLSADDVFTFRAVLCDNEIDRQQERFSLSALKRLKELFLGKTVIKDHTRKTDNQVARIYRTELMISADRMTAAGEHYTQLAAHCYMVRTESNADLIREVQGGIKREGSVGCSVGKAVCSICGADNMKCYCSHFPGMTYENQVCTFTLDDAQDAYEFSLVAVPAQVAAGACKSYGGTLMFAPDTYVQRFKRLDLRARLAAQKAKYDKTGGAEQV